MYLRFTKCLGDLSISAPKVSDIRELQPSVKLTALMEIPAAVAARGIVDLAASLYQVQR